MTRHISTWNELRDTHIIAELSQTETHYALTIDEQTTIARHRTACRLPIDRVPEHVRRHPTLIRGYVYRNGSQAWVFYPDQGSRLATSALCRRWWEDPEYDARNADLVVQGYTRAPSSAHREAWIHPSGAVIVGDERGRWSAKAYLAGEWRFTGEYDDRALAAGNALCAVCDI